MNIAFYLEKSEQFGQLGAFYVERHLKTLCQKLYQSHAGNVVEFAWQGGEPALLGLDFYKQAVEYQGICPRQTDHKRLSKPMALLLISNGLHFSNNIIFSLGFLLTV